jgi:hypothetical protein
VNSNTWRRDLDQRLFQLGLSGAASDWQQSAASNHIWDQNMYVPHDFPEKCVLRAIPANPTKDKLMEGRLESAFRKHAKDDG